jgi:hypothetical protein
MAYRVLSRVRTSVLRLCGHVPTGPRAVFDQSKERVRSPISPPPARKVWDWAAL